jgi:hypothetical protein
VIKQLVYGLATNLPWVQGLRNQSLGGSVSARYCYSVWLRHIVMANLQGLNTQPRIVAELGPGLSLGMGLAALISGSEKYLAFDVVDYSDLSLNLSVFDELVVLFKERAPIPDAAEFSRVKPFLKDYQFPSHIYGDAGLELALAPERLEKIRQALQGNDPEQLIVYKVPWYEANLIEENSVDMIFSQAVLEHVDDLDNTYPSMTAWLKPGAFMSHQIDFKCHGTATTWNGHWRHSNIVWSLIRGKRPYLLNRAPKSTHITLMKKNGLTVLQEDNVEMPSTFKQNKLAKRFREMSDEDLTCSGVFVIAQK